MYKILRIRDSITGGLKFIVYNHIKGLEVAVYSTYAEALIDVKGRR